MKRKSGGWLPEQRYLRGLFAGGTFCFQAQQVLQDAGIPVYSNTPLDSRYRLTNPEASLEHSVIDLGDDHFTQGKPHPMIDAGERRKRILREAGDPEVAVLLLDFVLGAMASPDPVGDLIGAIRQAQRSSRAVADAYRSWRRCAAPTRIRRTSHGRQHCSRMQACASCRAPRRRRGSAATCSWRAGGR